MDAEEFQEYGRQLMDYIVSYRKNVHDRKPQPVIAPGYLQEMVPDTAPEDGEKWDDVFNDIDRVIMPGMAHWTSNKFHAYFPSGSSYPSVLGDMLSSGLASPAFSWASCPAGTELEMCVTNWMAKMLKLPSCFLFDGDGRGGGCIQSTTSESTTVAMIAARTQASRRLKESEPGITQGQVIDRLVAYTSEEANFSVIKSGLIAAVAVRKLPTDEEGSLRGTTLEKAIHEDTAKGLLPFFLCATVGTTSSCAYDNLKELGPICQANGMWLHVDAAYAGNACICPEHRYLLDGVEHCMSLSINPHKWLLVNFDCATMWVQDRHLLTDTFELNATYLRFGQDTRQMPDLMNWQLPVGRRFRSLKLWFVIRMHGVKGLQSYLRMNIELAKQFENHVREDERFEIFGKVTLSLVCFRLKGDKELNQRLLDLINKDGELHLGPSTVKGTFFLRFVVGTTTMTSSDVAHAWGIIQEMATRALRSEEEL